MPGFLEASGYEGTERIDLGNGYWADVKRCLTHKEKGLVDEMLGGRQRVEINGQKQYGELNYTASRTEMVVQSLVAWNLDDPDGTVWPLDGSADRNGNTVYSPGCLRRQSVARLPGPVFDLIWQTCDTLNAPRKGSEAASFPGPGERGGPDGDGGAAGAAAVPVGAAVLDPAGSVAGDPDGGPPAS